MNDSPNKPTEPADPVVETIDRNPRPLKHAEIDAAIHAEQTGDGMKSDVPDPITPMTPAHRADVQDDKDAAKREDA